MCWLGQFLQLALHPIPLHSSLMIPVCSRAGKTRMFGGCVIRRLGANAPGDAGSKGQRTRNRWCPSRHSYTAMHIATQGVAQALGSDEAGGAYTGARDDKLMQCTLRWACAIEAKKTSTGWPRARFPPPRRACTVQQTNSLHAPASTGLATVLPEKIRLDPGKQQANHARAPSIHRPSKATPDPHKRLPSHLKGKSQRVPTAVLHDCWQFVQEKSVSPRPRKSRPSGTG